MKPEDILILVVDDEEDLREVLVETFEEFGFKVSSAVDGKDALKKCQETKFHLVITDLRMPNMNGQDLIKALKAKSPSVPQILAISGYSEFLTEELMNYGCDGFFAKPFNVDAVKSAIKNCLLRKEDLWKSVNIKNYKAKIEKRYSSFEKLQESHEVRFGRNGLFLSHKFDLPTPGESVEFTIKINDGNPWKQVQGYGKIVWIREDNKDDLLKGFGVEIQHIFPETIDHFVVWLEKLNPVASIPK